jgi:hypothetical protein
MASANRRNSFSLSGLGFALLLRFAKEPPIDQRINIIVPFMGFYAM